jgi:hypothetical protein
MMDSDDESGCNNNSILNLELTLSPHKSNASTPSTLTLEDSFTMAGIQKNKRFEIEDSDDETVLEIPEGQEELARRQSEYLMKKLQEKEDRKKFEAFLNAQSQESQDLLGTYSPPTPPLGMSQLGKHSGYHDDKDDHEQRKRAATARQSQEQDRDYDDSFVDEEAYHEPPKEYVHHDDDDDDIVVVGVRKTKKKNNNNNDDDDVVLLNKSNSDSSNNRKNVSSSDSKSVPKVDWGRLTGATIKDVVITAEEINPVKRFSPSTQHKATFTRLKSIKGIETRFLNVDKELAPLAKNLNIVLPRKPSKDDICNGIAKRRACFEREMNQPGANEDEVLLALLNQGPPKPISKSRLINVIFHPSVKPLFIKRGKCLDKNQLERGMKTDQEIFEKVANEYSSNKPEYSLVLFETATPLSPKARPCYYSPGVTWDELKKEWAALLREYSRVKSCIGVGTSGSHDPEAELKKFFNCPVYGYLYQHFEQDPDFFKTAKGVLPGNSGYESVLTTAEKENGGSAGRKKGRFAPDGNPDVEKAKVTAKQISNKIRIAQLQLLQKSVEFNCNSTQARRNEEISTRRNDIAFERNTMLAEAGRVQRFTDACDKIVNWTNTVIQIRDKLVDRIPDTNERMERYRKYKKSNVPGEHDILIAEESDDSGLGSHTKREDDACDRLFALYIQAKANVKHFTKIRNDNA